MKCVPAGGYQQIVNPCRRGGNSHVFRLNTASENSTQGRRNPTRSPPKEIHPWCPCKDLSPLIECRPPRGWAVVTRLLSSEGCLLSRTDALISCKYSCVSRSLSTARIQRGRGTARVPSCGRGFSTRQAGLLRGRLGRLGAHLLTGGRSVSLCALARVVSRTPSACEPGPSRVCKFCAGP